MRTYGKLSYNVSLGEWQIESIEPHVAIKLKALFTKIPKWTVPPYPLKDSPEFCRELDWFFQRYPFEISDHDRHYLELQKTSHLQKMETLERYMAPGFVPRKFPLKLELREYQGIAVELFLKNRILLLGDAVGLGKSPTAIGALTEPTTLPALIVVQTHLPTQWKEQIQKFTDLSVHLLKGTRPYELPSAAVYITKYSLLAGWTDIYTTGIFKSAIFDEIQELRIQGSNKYEAGKILAQNVDYCLGLSATPIYNYGDEIYNIMNLLKEGCLGPSEDFMREWTGYERKVKNPKALGTYLRENYLFLRRTREDVGRELPPVNKIVHTVDYDQDAVTAVEEIAKKLAIAATTGSFIERGQAARELDIRVRHATGVSKAKYVAEYVKILLENGEKVLLAGWHRDVYDIWLKELAQYKPVLYTGTESPAEKEKSKAAFISTEEGCAQVMMISLRSGIGLDGLQHCCSVVVFGELDWSPAVMEQVTGRLDRDGQENQVTAIYLVSDSGSDPLMIDLLGVKASQSRDIIDPLAVGNTVQHSDESRLKLLAEQYLKKLSS